MYQPSIVSRFTSSHRTQQRLKIYGTLLFLSSGPLLHGSELYQDYDASIQHSSTHEIDELKGHLDSLLRFIMLSKKQLSNKHNFAEKIMQCFTDLQNVTTLEELEEIRSTIYSLTGYQPTKKLINFATHNERHQEILRECDLILHKIVNIKLTPYQQACRTFAQSPLLQAATASIALGVTIAGIIKLNQKYNWSLFSSLQQQVNKIFPFTDTSSPSKLTESHQNNPYPNLALTLMGGIAIKLVADQAPAFCTTAAGYFNESMNNVWSVFDKFKANQQNIKPRGPSIQSLNFKHIADHGNLKSYLQSTVEYLINKPMHLALGVPHSSGVIIIGDTTESDRIAQATAALAHKLAQEQPISIFSQAVSQLTGGYFGGALEIPMQRYEAAEFVNTDTNIYDIINAKKLKTSACIIEINNLDMEFNPEQKARLVQKLNALSGLMNDPITQYFFIGTARNLKQVPQELYNSPMSLFKDIFTLTPHDTSIEAFMKCIHETMGIVPSVKLKQAFLAALREHNKTGRQKNIDFLRNILNRAIAIAQSQNQVVTEPMIIEQLAIG